MKGPAEAAVVVAGAAGVQRARLDLGRQVAFLQREQASAVKDYVGVGDAAILDVDRRRVRQFAAKTAEQRAAGVVLGLPFRGADPAVAIAGAAVLEMKGVQHAVADEPVRAGRLELRVGAVAIKRAVEFARQLALDLEEGASLSNGIGAQVGLRRRLQLVVSCCIGRSLILSLHRKDSDTGA